MYQVVFTRAAEKQKKFLKEAGLEKKTKDLLGILAKNPFQNPPPYDKLIADLQGYYSRRINIHHRLVYRVEESNRRVIVHSMWTHYAH